MQQHLADGLAAAEAAAAAVRAPGESTKAGTARGSSVAAVDQLAAALDGFDEPRAQAIFDRLLAEVTLDVFLSEIVMPYLRDLGARWERGEVTVAQEHFASNVVRGGCSGSRGVGDEVSVPARSSGASRRAARAGADRLRPRTAYAWLADRVPGSGYAARHDPRRRQYLDVDLVVVSAVTPERVGELVPELRQISHTPGGSRSAARGPKVWKRLHSMPSR